jgi:periplasmic protein TonB
LSATLKQTEVVAKAAADGTASAVSTMTVAIWVSIAIHAVLLTIHFQPELKKMADHLPSLNVVLVNAKTKTAPDKAELLAQANLDRGGNTDENRKMKTALPAPKENRPRLT